MDISKIVVTFDCSAEKYTEKFTNDMEADLEEFIRVVKYHAKRVGEKHSVGYSVVEE